jgi:hypothetical protein
LVRLIFILLLVTADLWVAANLFFWWRARNHPLGRENLRGYYWLINRKWALVLPVVLLVCVVAVIVSVNLYRHWEGIYWGGPFHPRIKHQNFVGIEKDFTGEDGKFDYPKYEAFVLRQFDLLDKGEVTDDLRLGLPNFLFHVQFLESRPIEEIRNLIPVLKKHISSEQLSLWYGTKEAFWPFTPTSMMTCDLPLGFMCREVLRAHDIE